MKKLISWMMVIGAFAGMIFMPGAQAEVSLGTLTPKGRDASNLSHEIKSMRERQAINLMQMKEHILKIERDHPEYVRKNQQAFERVKATVPYLEKSLQHLEKAEVREAFAIQTDFFSKMTSVLMDGINFMKEGEEKNTPLIGTFLKEEGLQVRYPKEKKMAVGQKPFFETKKYDKEKVVTNASELEQQEVPEEDGYMEALEHKVEHPFRAKSDAETIQLSKGAAGGLEKSVGGMHAENTPIENQNVSEDKAQAMSAAVAGLIREGGATGEVGKGESSLESGKTNPAAQSFGARINGGAHGIKAGSDGGASTGADGGDAGVSKFLLSSPSAKKRRPDPSFGGKSFIGDPSSAQQPGFPTNPFGNDKLKNSSGSGVSAGAGGNDGLGDASGNDPTSLASLDSLEKELSSGRGLEIGNGSSGRAAINQFTEGASGQKDVIKSGGAGNAGSGSGNVSGNSAGGITSASSGPQSQKGNSQKGNSAGGMSGGYSGQQSLQSGNQILSGAGNNGNGSDNDQANGTKSAKEKTAAQKIGGGTASQSGNGGSGAASNLKGAGNSNPVGSGNAPQGGSTQQKEELLGTDATPPETSEKNLENDPMLNAIQEWLLQEKLLIQELKNFKPVRQPNNPNPPWEYYILRQKQLQENLKQIRRRIELIGKRDEYFIELRKLSLISNRLLELMNAGEYTEYQAAAKAYDLLFEELDSRTPPPDRPREKILPSQVDQSDQSPEAYRPMISNYFKRLSEE